MKKLFTLAAVAIMTAMSAQAQDELVLDSICFAGTDGIKESKDVYLYNDKRQNTDLYSYLYHSLGENPVLLDEPILYGYMHRDFDERGVIQRSDIYSYQEDGPLYLSLVEEASEWNDEAQQYAVVTGYSSESPDEELALSRKSVITQFHGTIGPERREFYNWKNDEWDLFVINTFEYDEADRIIENTAYYVSQGYFTSGTYEYDDHGNRTHATVEMKMTLMGTETTLNTYEATYENDYYDDGHLRQVVTIKDGAVTAIETYYWGKGVTTAISEPVASSSEAPQRIVTLSGQVLNHQPTQPGIYIVNGKKIVVK